jgi:hypothetical protein
MHKAACYSGPSAATHAVTHASCPDVLGPCFAAVCDAELMLCCLLQAAEFWELGLEPFPVSAISGTGTGELSSSSSSSSIQPAGQQQLL